MKKFFTLVSTLCVVAVSAQDYPQQIAVPPLSSDPNQQFTVLHFDNQVKGEYSVLYYQQVGATVCRQGEFVPDTGGYVYSDKKLNDMVHGSAGVLLLKKLSFDASGKVLLDQKWILATRKFDGMGEYKLYFRRKYEHPLITNRSLLEYNIYNLDALKGLNASEMKAITELAMTFVPKEPQQVEVQQSRPRGIGDDLRDMKKQLSGINQVAGGFRGDLPSGEKVLTKFTFATERVFAVTKTKGDPFLLKFYVTPDYKKFDFIDSVRVSGDVNLVSVAPIYNTKSEPIGAFTNIHIKMKDEKGEEMTRQYSFAMDGDYKVTGWLHSLGKNKMGSMAAEFCWYEGDKLWVMSSNNERVFKPYMQLTQFVKGQPANTTFPATEEEKGTEKHIYAKTFQPEKPVGTSGVTTGNDKEEPLFITTVGESRYIITQDSRFNTTTSMREYTSINVIRVDGKGKVTNIDMMNEGSVAQNKMGIRRIIKNSNSEYYLIPFPVMLQEAFFEDKSELSPLTQDNSVLIQRWDKDYVSETPHGALILKRSSLGSKYTMLDYTRR